MAVDFCGFHLMQSIFIIKRFAVQCRGILECLVSFNDNLFIAIAKLDCDG